jgi:hypothetical protein
LPASPAAPGCRSCTHDGRRRGRVGRPEGQARRAGPRLNRMRRPASGARSLTPSLSVILECRRATPNIAEPPRTQSPTTRDLMPKPVRHRPARRGPGPPGEASAPQQPWLQRAGNSYGVPGVASRPRTARPAHDRSAKSIAARGPWTVLWRTRVNTRISRPQVGITPNLFGVLVWPGRPGHLRGLRRRPETGTRPGGRQPAHHHRRGLAGPRGRLPHAGAETTRRWHGELTDPVGPFVSLIPIVGVLLAIGLIPHAPAAGRWLLGVVLALVDLLLTSLSFRWLGRSVGCAPDNRKRQRLRSCRRPAWFGAAPAALTSPTNSVAS